MLDVLPLQLKNLAKKCPFTLYVVGGTCREYLAGFSPERRDYDICAPAPAEKFAQIAAEAGWEVCAIYKNTGTIKLRCAGAEYEFTSFRSDKYVRGLHVPAQIFFTDDIVADARRRDFTCNAVYFDICAGQFVDPLGGTGDIKAGVLRTVAPAGKVFGEDGLRLMRLARMSGSLGFTPSEECLEGAKENASLIRDISAERIFAELSAILCADKKYGVRYGHYRALKVLQASGVLKYVLPELALGEGMAQRSDFHDHDVLEHSLRCAMYAPADIRFAALLHDVGKPYCRINTGKYHGHEVEGERITREIMARLKAPSKLTELIARLVLWHMYDLDGCARESKVRRVIAANHDIFEQLMQLKQADYSACKDKLDTSRVVLKWRDTEARMRAEGVPFVTSQLNVRGNELIAAGVPACRCGEIIKKLLSDCAVQPQLNERERLIASALAFIKNNTGVTDD